MHIITFFIAWKSKYWYLCDFSWFFRVFGATPRCFPHVVDTDMLFSAVFSMFLDSNLPTTPSVNWKMCFVFGLWLQKHEENIINHTLHVWNFLGQKMPHSCTEWIFYLEAQKVQLDFYNVVLRRWQARMHTYTNKVRIQHKPGSLPVAAHWFFQMYLFWK